MWFLLLSILFLMPAAALAQDDTPGASARQSLLDVEQEHTTDRFYTASPVAMFGRLPFSYTQFDLHMELRREQEARLQPLGDGALIGGFRADSYRRIDNRSVSWAGARYIRGNRSNVRWNSTADYLLLYPYVMADSVGGDLSTEEYAFGGGYARRFGRIDAALRGDYRAYQEYRQVDPRPRNIVSDFTLQFGVGMALERYIVSFDLQGRLYKQNQKISFQRESNIIAELLMTGLGGYIPRYSGTRSSLDIAYSGTQYGVAVQLNPQQRDGWYLRGRYENLAMERNYRPNNSIPVDEMRTRRTSAEVAYRKEGWSIRAGGNFERRLGTEMVADRNGQGKIVDQQTTYENRIWHVAVEATVVWPRGALRYTFQSRAEWGESSSVALCPTRRMTLSQAGAALRGHVEWLPAHWRLKVTAGFGYYVAPEKKLELAGIADYLADYLALTADRLSSRMLAPETKLRAERQLPNRTACFLEAAWIPRFYGNGSWEHRFAVSCGFLF